MEALSRLRHSHWGYVTELAVGLSCSDGSDIKQMLNLSEFSQDWCLNVLLIYAMRGLAIQRNKHRKIRKQGITNTQHKTSVVTTPKHHQLCL